MHLPERVGRVRGMTGTDGQVRDDAGLLEWADSRRANAERARDIAMGVAVVLPVAIIVVVARVAFTGSKAPWLGPAAMAAGIIFVTGLAASMMLGVGSWLRTREFSRAVEASLPDLEPTPLADGERVGDLVAHHLGDQMSLEHRWSVMRLRVVRLAMCVLALAAGGGAGVLVVMMLGQGSLSLRAWFGIVGLVALACSTVVWVVLSRRPLAVRLRFDPDSRVLTVVRLSGVVRVSTVEVPFESVEALSSDGSKWLDSQRVTMVVGGHRIDIARYAAPRGNLPKRQTLGLMRAATEAHRALCAFRAGRLYLTIQDVLAGSAPADEALASEVAGED